MLVCCSMAPLLSLPPFPCIPPSTLFHRHLLHPRHSCASKLTNDLLGIMSNQGQICTATSRILVQESIYDKFIEAFKTQVKEVSVVGDPFAETTFQGPQVTKAQY